jgi:rare lipoprotein A
MGSRSDEAARNPARHGRPGAAVLAALALGVAGCSLFRPSGPGQVGTASWYGPEFQGSRTASGERFDQQAFTAAHPTLPLGTRARITNLENGRSVVVRINDRGPKTRGRVLDVSYAAARALGMLRRGTARVRIEQLDAPGRKAERGRARLRESARRTR